MQLDFPTLAQGATIVLLVISFVQRQKLVRRDDLSPISDDINEIKEHLKVLNGRVGESEKELARQGATLIAIDKSLE